MRAGYDRCADRYNSSRATEPPPGLGLLTARLRAGARVLDLGCGAGIPVTKTLAEKAQVTGVDFSAEQIRRARKNVPGVELIESDIMAVTFPPASFDAVVAFFVLFHLPRVEQIELRRHVHQWLVPGGLFLATVSVFNEEPYIEDDFFGVSMFWTNFSQEEYERLLAQSGFEVLGSTTVGHGYSESYGGSKEHHPLVLAQKGGKVGAA